MTSTENKKQQDIEIFFLNGETKIHSNFSGHQVGNTWVAIMTEDNRTVLYRTEFIDSITISVKE